MGQTTIHTRKHDTFYDTNLLKEQGAIGHNDHKKNSGVIEKPIQVGQNTQW